MREQILPGIDQQVGRAIDVVFGAPVAWIATYSVRKLRREPGSDEIGPDTRAWADEGRRISAVDCFLSIQDLKTFSRTVARFFTEVDVWRNPTLGQPPLRLDDHASSASFMAYPVRMANDTGNPAIPDPIPWNARGLPIGVHFLGRFSGEAMLLRLESQLEEARPWSQGIAAIFPESAEGIGLCVG